MTRAPNGGVVGLGHDERLAEAAVEADGDVAGDLDVLALVVADGHLVGVVEQDVRRLQRRVGEQAGGDELAFPLGRLVLELRHAGQLAEAHRALHDPGELAVLVDVALHEHGRHVRVEADGEQDGGEIDSALADHARLLGDGEGVQVDDAVEGVVLVLMQRPRPQRPEVTPEVDVARWLDARQHSRHDSRPYPRRPRSDWSVE